jgi:hypothetical protein
MGSDRMNGNGGGADATGIERSLPYNALFKLLFLEIYEVPALEPQHLAGLTRCCHFEAKPFDKPPRLLNLFRSLRRQFSSRNPDAVLKTDADISSLHQRDRRARGDNEDGRWKSSHRCVPTLFCFAGGPGARRLRRRPAGHESAGREVGGRSRPDRIQPRPDRIIASPPAPPSGAAGPMPRSAG